MHAIKHYNLIIHIILIRRINHSMNEHENKNKKVKIIAISGKDAADKTKVAKFLSNFLNATMVSWDDFNSNSIKQMISIDSNFCDNRLDNVLWALKNFSEITHPLLNIDLIPTRYIVFDTPLGRLDKQTNKYIDHCFYIDSPVADVLLPCDSRDIPNQHFFNDSLKISSDFIINGALSISAQVLAIKHYLSYQWYSANDFEHAI